MRAMLDITNEDKCACCLHCKIEKKESTKNWNAQGDCDKNFPFSRVFMNVIVECKEWELA